MGEGGHAKFDLLRCPNPVDGERRSLPQCPAGTGLAYAFVDPACRTVWATSSAAARTFTMQQLSNTIFVAQRMHSGSQNRIGHFQHGIIEVHDREIGFQHKSGHWRRIEQRPVQIDLAATIDSVAAVGGVDILAELVGNTSHSSQTFWEDSILAGVAACLLC